MGARRRHRASSTRVTSSRRHSICSTTKYHQYRELRPQGPVIALDVARAGRPGPDAGCRGSGTARGYGAACPAATSPAATSCAGPRSPRPRRCSRDAALLSGVAGAATTQAPTTRGEPRAGDAHRGPRRHHLVHGRTPAPTTGSAACNRRPPTAWCTGARIRTGCAARRGSRHQPHAVPLRRAHRPRAGPDLLLPGALGREAGAVPTPFTLIAGNAVGTDDYGLATGGPYRLHDARSRRRAGSCSRSRCATTCTWARRPPVSSASIPGIKGIQQVPGLPPYPEVMLESLVNDAKRLGARTCSPRATSPRRRCRST